MNRWRTWSVAICLAASLAPGCGAWLGRTAGVTHPVPAPLTWPAFDREDIDEGVQLPMIRGAARYSLESEALPVVAEVWSVGAAANRDRFWARVLRDRCAAREALQIANGGKADPDPICRAP